MLMKNKYFKRGGVSSEIEPDNAKMDYWPVETDQYEQAEYWNKQKKTLLLYSSYTCLCWTINDEIKTKWTLHVFIVMLQTKSGTVVDLSISIIYWEVFC